MFTLAYPSVSLLGAVPLRSYVHACSRAITRVPCRRCLRRVCMYVYVCVRVCTCVVAYVRHLVNHHTLPSRAFSRSLHRYESCTRESCRCSRQALPGRVSLSGNVPTEQPTLALTLCPFRGVLWRESRASLSFSFSLALSSLSSSLTAHTLLPSHSPPHPRQSPSHFHLRVLSFSLFLFLCSSRSYPTPPRSPLHG